MLKNNSYGFKFSDLGLSQKDGNIKDELNEMIELVGLLTKPIVPDKMAELAELAELIELVELVGYVRIETGIFCSRIETTYCISGRSFGSYFQHSN
jgi:hypothetical protein